MPDIEKLEKKHTFVSIRRTVALPVSSYFAIKMPGIGITWNQEWQMVVGHKCSFLINTLALFFMGDQALLHPISNLSHS